MEIKAAEATKKEGAEEMNMRKVSEELVKINDQIRMARSTIRAIVVISDYEQDVAKKIADMYTLAESAFTILGRAADDVTDLYDRTEFLN